ncbi:MAG: hypothetical protein IJZ70_03115 [Bacteroidales bacterium]|nr:hypothetical protein [Bacteroidales bacterium]
MQSSPSRHWRAHFGALSCHKEGSRALAHIRVIDVVAEADAKEIDEDMKRDALKVFEAI